MDTAPVEGKQVVRAPWKRQLWIAVGIGALGVAGPAIEARTEGVAWWYWVLVLPVFALLSLQLMGPRPEGQTFWQAAGKQLLHWLGVLIALHVVALLAHTGELDRAAGGIVALLVLGLGCYAAAVHVHRVFYLSTALLWGGAVLAMFVREHLWAVAGIMIVAGGALYAWGRIKK